MECWHHLCLALGVAGHFLGRVLGRFHILCISLPVSLAVCATDPCKGLSQVSHPTLPRHLAQSTDVTVTKRGHQIPAEAPGIRASGETEAYSQLESCCGEQNWVYSGLWFIPIESLTWLILWRRMSPLWLWGIKLQAEH